MATNDDLDDFFKKKDRKGHKHKKQTSLLTNNEQLLKQLVIVTSATTAFKENLDFDEDDDSQMTNDGILGNNISVDEQHKSTSHHKSKISDETMNSKVSNGQTMNVENNSSNIQQQQDEWEEFIDNNYKYEQIRSKLTHTNNNNDEFNDDDDNNDDNNRNSNGNETNLPSDYSKDKPVWKISELQQSIQTPIPQIETKTEELTVKPTGGAYRPPQLRSGATGSVTVVSGLSQRTNKKKEPNLASTDEFPTLQATVNKK